MRLLFVSHSFPPLDAPLENVGGMQRVATELHAALEARGDVDVRPVVLRSSWRWVHVRAVPFLTSLALRLGHEAAAHDADAILFGSMTTALPALLLGGRLRARGIRLAAIAHGLDVTEPNPVYQWAIRRLCRSLDVVMPVSRATRNELVARGLPLERAHVVPNAIDLERLVPVSADASRGGSLPALPRDAFLLVSVGRQVRRKGFAWFVDAVMPDLPEHVHLWLAGEGPERSAIEAAIARRGLAHRVRCLGKISDGDVRALYARGDLFVMPNVAVPGDMEGFGIVMLEAGACGLPTLAAELEGIRDVVEEGVNGWLVPSGDACAFAARIRSIANDPSTLRAASARAKRYVTDTFRWSESARRYLDALRSRVTAAA